MVDIGVQCELLCDEPETMELQEEEEDEDNVQEEMDNEDEDYVPSDSEDEEITLTRSDFILYSSLLCFAETLCMYKTAF